MQRRHSFFRSIKALLTGLLLTIWVSEARADGLRDHNGDGFADAADIVFLANRIAELGPLAEPGALSQFDLNRDGFLGAGDIRLGALSLIGRGTDPVDVLVTEPSIDLVITTNSEFEIRGRANEPAEIVVGGREIGIVEGEFSARVSLREGMNLVEVLARRPGSENEGLSIHYRPVILDLTPPFLTVDLPTHQAVLSETRVEVRGTVSDNISDIVSVGAISATGPRQGELEVPRNRIEITVRTVPGGQVVDQAETFAEAFGEWGVEVGLADGINDITVRAIDAAGLDNFATVRVRTFISAEGIANSPDGAEVRFPEGAFPGEEMVVRVHDITSQELSEALEMEFLTSPPPGGLENFPLGTIILPNAMMIEIERAPENGQPAFQRPVEIAIPNVTNADNTMPIWIFEVQPDMDGNGRPQLTLAARGVISDDGEFVEARLDKSGPVDEIFPGPFSGQSRRFEETELHQVSNAKSVRNLIDRLEGRRSRPPDGPNVFRAQPRNPQPAAPEPIAAPVDDVAAASAVPAEFSSAVSIHDDDELRQTSRTILIDDFEDGSLLNKLSPPGITFVVESGSSIPHPTNPILPLTDDGVAGHGNPSTVPPGGVNGGARVRGNFGPEAPGEARIVMTLLGRDLPYNQERMTSARVEFDVQSLRTNDRYEVALEDGYGPIMWAPFNPTSSWTTVQIPFIDFGEIDRSDLRRISFRVAGAPGSEVNLAIDNVKIIGASPSLPPTYTPVPTSTATPIPSPTPTEPEPTMTPAPTLTPQPTATPPPPATRTPAPSPTPRPTDPVPPIDTPIPTATPPDDDPQLKTQVTFYCCAASIIVPFKGKTKCDDDANVDQQRLRECIALRQQELRRCTDELNRVRQQWEAASNRMTRGYRSLFNMTDVGGTEIPLVVGGSLYGSITSVSGPAQGTSAGAWNTGLGVAADGIQTAQDIRTAAQSGSRDDIQTAVLNGSQRSLEGFINVVDTIPENRLPDQLRGRDGFKKGWQGANIFKNLFNGWRDVNDMGFGFGDAEELRGRMESLLIQCEFVHNQLRRLKNCEKGSSAWVQCAPDVKGFSRDGTVFDAKEFPELARFSARHARVSKRISDMTTGLKAMRGQIETFLGSTDSLGSAMDLSVQFEQMFDSLGDAEAAEMALLISEHLRFAWEGLASVYEQSDQLADNLLQITAGLQVIDDLDALIMDADRHVQELIEFDVATDEGGPGVVVNVMGQNDGNIGLSQFGGDFVGYRFAFASRSGDTVTFQGASADVVAQLPDTLFRGSRMVNFPPLTFNFTPSQTMEFDQYIEVGYIPITVGVDDREGVPPTVELSIPPSDKQLASPLILPPRVPFYASAVAEDDIVIFSTRFLLDGQPTEALGTRDFVGNPDPFEFGAYFLTPNLDEGENVRDVVVEAQAIDAGGNISTSASGVIRVDRDAPLLLTVSPQRRHTTTEGPAIVYTATLTDGGAELEDPVWFVEGVLGGNARVGTINEEGIYTPPTRVPRMVLPVEIQVISDSNPALVGLARVDVAEPFAVADSAYALNAILPDLFGGYAVSVPIYVVNAILSDVFQGYVTSPPVSVLNIPPVVETMFSVLSPYSEPSLSGYDISPPVMVDQEP